MGDDGQRLDLIVVGAGGCGLMAALVAADLGADVLVLEKTAAHGGGTALSHRGVRGAGTRFQAEVGISDDPATYAEEITRRGRGRSDPDLVEALAGVSAEMIEFLADRVGVAFRIDDFAFGQRAARSHVWDPDLPITDLMFSAASRAPNLSIELSAAVEGLIHDDGVDGVVLADGRRLRSSAVLLATGGFGASAELLGHHIPRAVGIAYPGHPGTTGDGIRMGLAAGGSLVNMGAFQPYPAHVGPDKVGVPPGVIMSGGIVVEPGGTRFVDETRYPGGLADAMLDLPGARAFEVFDQRIFDEHADATDERSIVAMLDRGVLRRAASAEALATDLGIAVAPFERTLAEHDAAAGGRDRLGRAVEQALRPPYYGIPITVALYHTQGGLRVDRHGRVLRADGTPIPGLYAGGGAAVGVSGDGLDGYLPGNGLLASLGLGMLAARHAVARTDP